ncbi:MAG: sugar ABC transporter permease [Alicyclobacillus sp.]|nr:sugar ABC transporter permease [Alicyclobacillus sp.]
MVRGLTSRAAVGRSCERGLHKRWFGAWILPYALLAPMLLLIGLTIVYPMWRTFVLAFSQVSRIGRAEHFGTFINFMNLFASNPIGQVFWQTLIWVVVTVGAAFVLAYPTAVLLNAKFRFRSWVYALVVLPWAAPLSIATLSWEWIFHGELGPLNQILSSLGIIHGFHQWLGTPTSAMIVVLCVGIWSNISFMVVVLLAGMQAIEPELYEASSLDGANEVAQFFKITWPLMRPVNNLVIVLSVLWAFNAFPIIWILTQGGPAGSTDIVVTLIYKLSFVQIDFGQASALSTLTLLLMSGFTAAYFWISSGQQRFGRGGART